MAHGFFLNTHGFSAFDVGANRSGELWVSSPDPVLDYFLFAGPSPAAVLGQFTTVTGRMSLPPKWAMGLKYDPLDRAQNEVPLAALCYPPVASPRNTDRSPPVCAAMFGFVWRAPHGLGRVCGKHVRCAHQGCTAAGEEGGGCVNSLRRSGNV